jgi:hypothetical protein
MSESGKSLLEATELKQPLELQRDQSGKRQRSSFGRDETYVFFRYFFFLAEEAL